MRDIRCCPQICFTVAVSCFGSPMLCNFMRNHAYATFVPHCTGSPCPCSFTREMVIPCTAMPKKCKALPLQCQIMPSYTITTRHCPMPPLFYAEPCQAIPSHRITIQTLAGAIRFHSQQCLAFPVLNNAVPLVELPVPVMVCYVLPFRRPAPCRLTLPLRCHTLTNFAYALPSQTMPSVCH